jgi:3-hydroxyisobutyrate dehydrogenase-like beta-hydroxyacid dehydrogenase
MRASVIGLGAMGLPIARNLLKAGHEVTVYNRTAARAEVLRSEGARVASSVTDAAAAEVVLTMLADDAALEAVALREGGLVAALPRGGIHVSLSTISPALSRRLDAAHRERGQAYLAAPVFGRPDAAAAARLVIAVAGEAESIERCRPLFAAIGRALHVVGPRPEQANLLKLAGNFLIVSAIESLGEAFALLRKGDVDPKLFLEIVNGGLFQSPVYQSYGTQIAEERFEPPGFKLRLGLKDVRLALAAADSSGVPLPIASLLHDRLLAAIGRGKGDKDWAALAELMAEEAGLGKG